MQQPFTTCMTRSGRVTASSHFRWGHAARFQACLGSPAQGARSCAPAARRTWCACTRRRPPNQAPMTWRSPSPGTCTQPPPASGRRLDRRACNRTTGARRCQACMPGAHARCAAAHSLLLPLPTQPAAKVLSAAGCCCAPAVLLAGRLSDGGCQGCWLRCRPGCAGCGHSSAAQAGG